MIYKNIVCRDDSSRLTWPDVAVAQSGRLVCVLTERSGTVERRTTRVVCVTSGDRGRTWSERRPVTPALEYRSVWDTCWHCPRITALRNGRLAVMVDCVSTPQKKGAFLGERSNWLCISGDGGETWDIPRKLPVTGALPDRIVELGAGPHAGRWITTTHVVINGRNRSWLPQAWISDNRGKDWDGPFIIADEPGLQLCEASVLALPEGELVCFLRNRSKGKNETWRAVSRDGGITWGEAVPFPLPGCYRPSARILVGEQVLVSYCFSQNISEAGGCSENLFCAMTDVDSCLGSPEDAKVRIMPLDYDRSAHPDIGCSGWVGLEDGSIYVVNHIVDNTPEAHIRGYHFRMGDIILPKPDPMPVMMTRSGSPFPVIPRSGFVPPRSNSTAPPFPMRSASQDPFPPAA
ncbi:MAG: glycoside hydrolase [Opitutaceae bacterium]|jgi:sialidase-1|nr:glycoside hydrolase [Opitutaceae bacterium]